MQIQVVCVEVQEGLLNVGGALGLKDGGGGGDDRGLARRVNGLKLKLGAHPQAPVGAGVGNDLHLRGVTGQSDQELHSGGHSRHDGVQQVIFSFTSVTFRYVSVCCWREPRLS